METTTVTPEQLARSGYGTEALAERFDTTPDAIQAIIDGKALTAPVQNAVFTDKAAAFVIDTEDRANWYLGKLATNEAEKARIKAQAAQRLAEIDADTDALRFRFEAQAREWARQEGNRRKRQDVTVLQGTFSFRAFKAGFRVVDEAAAVAHARETLPELVTVETQTIERERFDKAAYIAAAQETGEVLPGLDSHPAGETFAVKFPEPGKAKGRGKAAAPDAEEGEAGA